MKAPCIIRDDLTDNDNQATVILIEDNIRRRNLSPAEMTKATARLYELKGIKQGSRGDLTSTLSGDVDDISKEVGIKRE